MQRGKKTGITSQDLICYSAAHPNIVCRLEVPPSGATGVAQSEGQNVRVYFSGMSAIAAGATNTITIYNAYLNEVIPFTPTNTEASVVYEFMLAHYTTGTFGNLHTVDRFRTASLTFVPGVLAAENTGAAFTPSSTAVGAAANIPTVTVTAGGAWEDNSELYFYFEFNKFCGGRPTTTANLANPTITCTAGVTCTAMDARVPY